MRGGPGWYLTISAIALVLLALFGFRLAQEVREYRRAQEIQRRYEARRAALRDRKTALERLVEALERDPLTQERLIRSFGYVKRGESVFVIPRKPTSSP